MTAEIVGRALGLAVRTDDALREVRFGVQEGQPMQEWFHEWIDGLHTPPGAEPFAELRARAVGAINRALALPAPVLVVAHGALFRSLRSAMGLPAHERLPNAVPVWCEPDGAAWRLLPA